MVSFYNNYIMACERRCRDSATPYYIYPGIADIMLNTLDFDDEDYKSKSQAKREMHQLQALGEHLIEFSVDKLQQLNLPDKLLQAVLDAKSIQQRGAHKRQLQYIGRIMRDIDADELEQKLKPLKETKPKTNQLQDQLDKLLNELLQQGDAVISEIVAQFPDIDRQQLRNLLRNTRQKNTEKAQRAVQQLRLFLKSQLEHRL